MGESSAVEHRIGTMDRDIASVNGILSEGMVARGFPLIYKGPLDHDTMKFFTAMARERVTNECENKSIQRKVFHVMVEMIQNVTKHSASSDMHGKEGDGIFVVGKTETYFYIITGNHIAHDKVNTLSCVIENLNSLDEEELTRLYKEKIRQGGLSEKGGAGLGLIDIVRKSNHHLDYHFATIDDESKFFILKASVDFENAKQRIEVEWA